MTGRGYPLCHLAAIYEQQNTQKKRTKKIGGKIINENREEQRMGGVARQKKKRDFFRSFQGSLTLNENENETKMMLRPMSQEQGNYGYSITSCLQFNVKNFVFYPKNPEWQ